MNTKCYKCHGCGKVANDTDQTPWTFWEELPPGSDLAVQLGMVSPTTCPRCKGTGLEPNPSSSLELRKSQRRRRRPWPAFAFCLILLICLFWIVYVVLCVLYAGGSQ